MIAGLGHQDGIGAQTDTGPQPDEAVGQGTVVHHIGHPELAHAVAAEGRQAEAHGAAPQLGEARDALQIAHQLDTQGIGHGDDARVPRHDLVVAGAEILTVHHGRHQTADEVAGRDMRAVAERQQLDLVLHGCHPLEAVMVLLAAALGETGHHMPQLRIAGLQLARDTGCRFVGGSRDDDGVQGGIILPEQAFQGLAHTRMVSPGRHDQAGAGPVRPLGGGLAFFAVKPAAHPGQEKKQGTLQQRQHKEGSPHNDLNFVDALMFQAGARSRPSAGHPGNVWPLS